MSYISEDLERRRQFVRQAAPGLTLPSFPSSQDVEDPYEMDYSLDNVQVVPDQQDEYTGGEEYYEEPKVRSYTRPEPRHTTSHKTIKSDTFHKRTRQASDLVVGFFSILWNLPKTVSDYLHKVTIYGVTSQYSIVALAIALVVLSIYVYNENKVAKKKKKKKEYITFYRTIAFLSLYFVALNIFYIL